MSEGVLWLGTRRATKRQQAREPGICTWTIYASGDAELDVRKLLPYVSAR